MGWWNTLDGEAKQRVKAELHEGEDPVGGLIRLAFESKARMSIIPLQDLLGLGSHARMNTPGTSENNWKWSFSWPQLNILQVKLP
jgi:4-alpha-glucanotransferase